MNNLQAVVKCAEMVHIIQCAKIALNSPMQGEPSLEYYCTIESDLLNCIIACVQRLDLELKFHSKTVQKHVSHHCHRHYCLHLSQNKHSDQGLHLQSSSH